MVTISMFPILAVVHWYPRTHLSLRLAFPFNGCVSHRLVQPKEQGIVELWRRPGFPSQIYFSHYLEKVCTLFRVDKCVVNDEWTRHYDISKTLARFSTLNHSTPSISDPSTVDCALIYAAVSPSVSQGSYCNSAHFLSWNTHNLACLTLVFYSEWFEPVVWAPSSCIGGDFLQIFKCQLFSKFTPGTQAEIMLFWVCFSRAHITWNEPPLSCIALINHLNVQLLL